MFYPSLLATGWLATVDGAYMGIHIYVHVFYCHRMLHVEGPGSQGAADSVLFVQPLGVSIRSGIGLCVLLPGDPFHLVQDALRFQLGSDLCKEGYQVAMW